jgi:hypothetical protein
MVATNLPRRSHLWFEIDPTWFHRQSSEPSSKCWEVTGDDDKQALPVCGKRRISPSQSSLPIWRDLVPPRRIAPEFSKCWIIIRDRK